jgi:1D-myo-inositol-tetrakisphosphate 5-kinase/inositol-polyphosphate multikinase
MTAEATDAVRETHTLSSQVGGHGSVLTSDDDSLVIKPTLPLEIAFYQTINTEAAFALLRPFVPNFIGTLRLEGQLIQPDGDIEQNNIRIASDKADKSESLISRTVRLSDGQHSPSFWRT